MVAGTAALSHLRDHPQIYQYLEQQGERLAKCVNDYCQKNAVPARMKQVGSMFHMFFQDQPVHSMRDVRGEYGAAEKAFYLHSLNAGVLVPGTQRAFLCAAHTEAEIDRLIEVFTTSLGAVQHEGLFRQPQK